MWVWLCVCIGGWGGSSGVRDKKTLHNQNYLLQLQFCQDLNTRVRCFIFVIPLHEIYYPEEYYVKLIYFFFLALISVYYKSIKTLKKKEVKTKTCENEKA